jgi:hypothetical protein
MLTPQVSDYVQHLEFILSIGLLPAIIFKFLQAHIILNSLNQKQIGSMLSLVIGNILLQGFWRITGFTPHII